MKKKKKTDNSYKIGIFIIAILLIIGFTSMGIFLKDMLFYKETEELYEEIGENIVFEDDYTTAQTEDFKEITYPNLDIDYKALREINPDFAGVVYIPATDTCYPIAHSKDNNEYLNTTFDGRKSSVGCIFLDKYASGNYDDINTFLFGHNMKNKSMFGNFKRFLREDGLCDSDPFVYIYTEDKVLKYHIFFYGLVPAGDAIYDDFPMEKYDWYVNRQLGRNAYKEYYASCERLGIVDEFKDKPKLLTMSTCYGYGHKQFMLCQAAFMGEANTQLETEFEFTY